MSSAVAYPAPLLSELFLVICTGCCHYDLFRGNDQSALGRCCSVEHLLDHGLECIDNGTFRYILSFPLDLVPFKSLCIVDGDGDPAVIGTDILQCGIEEYISYNQLAVIRNILECNRNDIRLAIGTGCQIPDTVLQQILFNTI